MKLTILFLNHDDFRRCKVSTIVAYSFFLMQCDLCKLSQTNILVMKPSQQLLCDEKQNQRGYIRQKKIIVSRMNPIIAMLAACLMAGLSTNGQGNMNMVGAWQMTKQMANDGKKDTLLKQEQLKIYTHGYMMYASPRATDSFGEYGIATYRVEGDKVIENIFYTSSAGDVKDSAFLKVTKLNNGYRQVIDYSDANGTLLLIEDYKKVGKADKTPLDGAWKQVKNMSVSSSGDSVNNPGVTQFKVYQSGYFIWANPSKDPASNNFVTAYGYGTFKMSGDSKMVETNKNSTYHDLVGRPVNIEIKIINENAYKQTITNEDGSKSIEVYERMK